MKVLEKFRIQTTTNRNKKERIEIVEHENEKFKRLFLKF